MVFILLAALGIILAAVLLNRNDDKKSARTATPPANTVTTTVQAPTPAQPANVSIQVPGVVGRLAWDGCGS